MCESRYLSGLGGMPASGITPAWCKTMLCEFYLRRWVGEPGLVTTLATMRPAAYGGIAYAVDSACCHGICVRQNGVVCCQYCYLLHDHIMDINISISSFVAVYRRELSSISCLLQYYPFADPVRVIHNHLRTLPTEPFTGQYAL